MNICLINPPRLLTLDSLSLRATPPLGLAYIAGALVRAGHKVKVIDAIAAAPNQATEFQGEIILHGLHDIQIANLIDADVDVIGVGCMFSNNWLANRRLINLLGQRFASAKIIIGGEHATAVADLCLDQCECLDAVVMGEGEETIVDLVDAFQNFKALNSVESIVYRDEKGKVITTSPRKRKREIEEIAWPAWELFPIEDYMEHKFSYGVDRGRSLPVMATRGCPYTCTFCSSPQMWGTRYFMRSPLDMADEIEKWYNVYSIRNFDFYDLTAVISKNWIIDFCKELVSRKLDITWQIPAGTRSEAIDEEVAEWLYRSGCRNITYAPESGSPEILKAIRKKVHLDKMLNSIKASYNQKLNIKLNMMIGFPIESHSHIWETVWFLIQASWAGAHDALPSIFSPYPGSVLFEELKNQGQIDLNDDDYWRRIIFADDYSKGIVYSQKLSKNWLLFYVLIQLIAFYSSNFLFRPLRLIKTIRNLITKNYESRAEITFAELSKRRIKWTLLKESDVILQKSIPSNAA